MLKENALINSGSNRPVALSGDSSVGRAIDCRSIGRVFNSLSPDLFRGRHSLSCWIKLTIFHVLLAQLAERTTFNRVAMGSSPIQDNI